MGSHAKKLEIKGGITPRGVMAVAKDGTRRGGKRIGAGRKPKALNDKVNAGAEANVISFPGADEMVGVEMPPVKEYLKAEQRNGGSLGGCPGGVWLYRQRRPDPCPTGLSTLVAIVQGRAGR